MILKAPKFWSSKNAVSTALMPLSALYLIAHKAHQKSQNPYKAACPVICVGNAVVGGSGKTPTVLALVDMVRDLGLAKNPYILTRGYGGSLEGPVQVDAQIHSSRAVGDEAMMLAKKAPVIKSADRAAGAKLATDSGADLIIMDDGLQNPGLYKDIKVLVVDAMSGFGNERLLPAGPLRSPLNHTLENADLILTIGKRSDNVSLFSLDEEVPTLWAYLDTDEEIDTSKKYVAFAGIGHPEKFKRTLERHGVEIAGWYDFPDHYAFSSGDIEKLKREADKKGAQLITTSKDFMRIPSAYKKYVHPLPVSLAFEEREELEVFLKQRLERG